MITILDATDKEREQAVCFVDEIYKNEAMLYDRACTIVKKLGLGGMWKGHILAMAVVLKALKFEQMTPEEQEKILKEEQE